MHGYVKNRNKYFYIRFKQLSNDQHRLLFSKIGPLRCPLVYRDSKVIGLRLTLYFRVKLRHLPHFFRYAKHYMAHVVER